jgi:hypothetical protein
VLTFTPVPLTLVFPPEIGGQEAMRTITILAGVWTALAWLGRRVARGRLHG